MKAKKDGKGTVPGGAEIDFADWPPAMVEAVERFAAERGLDMGTATNLLLRKGLAACRRAREGKGPDSPGGAAK